jgi:Short C-terminal domain
VDWGRRSCIARAVLVALAILAFGASAAEGELVVVDGLSIPVIVKALKKQPVVVGYGANPDVASPDVIALRALVRKVDRGRIWIVVTPPRSEKVEGELANQIQTDLNKDGVVVCIGGYNFYVATTWGNNSDGILSGAVSNPNLTFPQYLHNIITAFARADARAHHPTPLADSTAPPKKAAQQGIPTTTTSTATSPSENAGTATAAHSTTTAAASTTAATPTPTHKSSSSSTALIVVLAAVAVLVLIGVTAFGRQARRSAEARKREREEIHAKAEADLTKLGERISDLDIDQQMPNADPAGKAAYVKALDCYQGGERRLKQENDPYEFDKAIQVIAAGLKHIDEAEELFNNHGRARDLLPADVISRLTKLAALHKSGALTDEEFSAEKHKLLS